MSGQHKIFNDPVHGTIKLHPLLVKIIDTPQFQRLRNIKQLGLAYYVYPGASHNRFEHSIGTAHLAGELIRILKEKQPELDIDERDILCVEIAGLCHDLGHGPFSHTFDQGFLPRVRPDCDWKHEKGSCDMLDYLIEENELKDSMKEWGIILKQDLPFIKEMIEGDKEKADSGEWTYVGRGKEKGFLYEIISNATNKVDVDKWDYFARDCHHLGIPNTFDHFRFMQFLKVMEVDGKWHICARDKEYLNLFEMFQTRSVLHRKAYQHKVCKAIDLMVCDALVKANDHLLFIGQNGRKMKMSEAVDDPKAFMQLTDDIFGKILHSDDPNLEPSRDILSKILRREIYQIIGEVREYKEDEKSLFVNMKENKEAILKEVCEVLGEKDLSQAEIDINFGNGNSNPVDSYLFYSKQDPEVAKDMKGGDVSPMLANVFRERSIVVYSICRSHNEKEEKRERFQTWKKMEEQK